MSGSHSRNKGARGEREFLAILGDELGEQLHRNLSQTRGGGADCIEILGWAVEVKWQRRLCIPAWWRQAVTQSVGIGEPLLAVRMPKARGRPLHEAWRCFVHAGNGSHRETTVQGAAEAIREKWLRWP